MNYGSTVTILERIKKKIINVLSNIKQELIKKQIACLFKSLVKIEKYLYSETFDVLSSVKQVFFYKWHGCPAHLYLPMSNQIILESC